MPPKHHRTGKSNAFAGTEGHFLFPHHEDELKRIREQHELMLSNTNGELIKTPLPKAKSNIRLLDVGCVDGTWLNAVEDKYPDYDWSLHGVDIHTAFFRHKTDADNKLDLHKHDATKPFPGSLGWENSFDIVHQRLMVLAVKSDAWLHEVQNLVALLKPGGWLQLVELSWIVNEKEADPAPIMQKLTKHQRWIGDHFGFDIDVQKRLAGLMKDAGLSNVNTYVQKIGYGAKVKDEKLRKTSADMFGDTSRHFEQKMPPAGIPGVAKDPDELHEFLDELAEYIYKYGYEPRLHVVVGQK